MVKIINQNVTKGVAGKRPGNPKGIVIHNDAGGMSAEQYLAWLPNHNWNAGFAHYYIDRNAIVRTEETYNSAWHTATTEGNTWYIGYEVVQSMNASDKDFLANEQMVFKQAAEDLLFYKLPANRDTVRLHREFSATSCPHRSWALHGQSVNAVKDYFISQIKLYMTGGTGSSNTEKPNVTPPATTPTTPAGAKFKVGENATVTKEAKLFATGEPFASFVLGSTYQVAQVEAKTQSNSKYRYLLKNSTGVLGWVLEQDLVGGSTPVPAPSPKPPTTSGWKSVAENGTFVPNTTVAIKPEPTVTSKQIDVYSAGQRINYDSYVNNDGHIWISYISYSGARRYVAVRQVNKDAWGTFY